MSGQENKTVSEVQEQEQVTVDDQFKSIFKGIHSLNTFTKDLQSEVKVLHKLCKTACKPKKVKKHTVMHDPMKISPELLKYLGKEEGTNLTKSECMKLVSGRVKSDGLQNAENKRQFTPNKKLAKILNMPNSAIKSITFVELNKYLAHHYTSC